MPKPFLAQSVALRLEPAGPAATMRRRWGDDGLWSLLGPAWGQFANHTNLYLAVHAQREVIHHGAEIALLRDLHAARS